MAARNHDSLAIQEFGVKFRPPGKCLIFANGRRAQQMSVEAVLNNPRAFTIITGAVSAILAAVVLGRLGHGARRKQAQERAARASLEVVASLRTSVAEGMIPSEATILALLRASARRNGVDVSHMWSPRQVADEIVREIMDNPFLAGQEKMRLAESFATLQSEEEMTDETSPIEPESSSWRITVSTRLVLPLITGLFAVFIANALGLKWTWTGALVWLVVIIGAVGAMVILSAIVFVLVSNLGKQAESETEEKASA